ncbi:hypothetical protein RDI58_000691 [Solanum bulbocastanum]|uniref:Uncharacterized protein n=1 Tax=Solanum bulbocastanum TaxID=147425 RepID=A0AAN8YSL9_SOLBU
MLNLFAFSESTIHLAMAPLLFPFSWCVLAKLLILIKFETIPGNKKRVIHSSEHNSTKGLRPYVTKIWFFMKLIWYTIVEIGEKCVEYDSN